MSSAFNYDYMAERLDQSDRDILRMLKAPTPDIVNKLIDRIEELEGEVADREYDLHMMGNG